MKEIFARSPQWLRRSIMLAILGTITPVQAAEVACTEAPDCASLGYTKTASQCPDGGIKCPFDGNKMFCVSGESMDFQFQNAINLYDVVYSDGSTSAAYDGNKLAVGIVVYVHPNGKKNHGWIMSLDQPPAQLRAEAVKRCAGYATKGTRAGDWHLPDVGELMMLSSGNDNSTEYADLNSAIKKIPGSMQLGSSYSEHYCMTGAADMSKTYINGSPSCTDKSQSVGFNACDTRYVTGGIDYGSPSVCYNNSSGTPSCNNWKGSKVCQTIPANKIYGNNFYWSISDALVSTNLIYANLSAPSGWEWGSPMDAKYGHYRCMANF